MTLTKRTMAESLERRIVELPLGGTRYCVIGPKMAVDFHVDDLDRAYKLAGLECHYKQRGDVMPFNRAITICPQCKELAQ